MAISTKDRIALTAAPCVFRRKDDTLEWFLVKTDTGSDWEIPKVNVKPVESSVRASIRVLAEQGGMTARVLEEVGRHGGAGRVNGKIVTQRTIYYLMLCKDAKEILGYADSTWASQATALKKLKNKRDVQMIKDAKALLKVVEEKRGKPFKSKTW